MIKDWRTHTRATDDGHLIWTAGSHHGTPALYEEGRKRSVPAHVYAQIHGRPPRGNVTTTCQTPGCVRPEHLEDGDDRQRRRLAQAQAQDSPALDGYCAKGHTWADSVRFDGDTKRRCGHCRQGVPPVVHETAVDMVLSGVPFELARTDALEVVRRAICVKGLTHIQAARLVERSPRTVARWTKANGWRRPP